MKILLQPVILSGGSGTRLWPLSRKGYPKQFLSLFGKYSLFQETLSRISSIQDILPPIVVCNEDHRFLAAEQAKILNKPINSILLEPEAKNTAPAIALAAHKCLNNGQDPLLLVLPSDHVIIDIKKFHYALNNAKKNALNNKMVTFGIHPTNPETGYGYIQSGKMIEENAYEIKKFIEKPDAETAQYYLNSGGYYWNSGIFMFKASKYLDELEKYCPGISNPCKEAVAEASSDLDFFRVEKEKFKVCKAESIDYAVMEKTDCAVVIPLDAGWSDVGAWSSVWNMSDKDKYGNATHGDVLIEDTKDSYVYSSNRLVCGIGLENISIIETSDVVMVIANEKSQSVKKVVDKIENLKRIEIISHRQVFRPWGYYDSVDSGARFKVKRIVVKPGEKLSLQKHHHRAEHWIVVSGVAKITLNKIETLLTENQSTYIPIGTIHRLENPGKIDLHLIEVQSGEYLEEDDIIRYEDNYGRST